MEPGEDWATFVLGLVLGSLNVVQARDDLLTLDYRKVINHGQFTVVAKDGRKAVVSVKEE